MSDPEGPKHEQPGDVDDVVDSANAGLADAAAARGDVPETTADAVDEPAATPAVDPDLAAFEEAERSHPGTFFSAVEEDSEIVVEPSGSRDSRRNEADTVVADAVVTDTVVADAVAADPAVTSPAIADTAYAPPFANDAETRVMPSEPVGAPAQSPQPIFVQAPEPPSDLGNRGAIAGIGLLAAIVFAILYFGTALGLGALAGDVTGENVGEMALGTLPTWGLWVPVVVFYLGFCLLGAIINRGRWGLWVVFGLIVGLFAYAGHLLGQLFEAPFWTLSASQGTELVTEQLFAPLAIAAFVFGRELTIWFGAWAARLGARKTELNAEAQREYERTLEAGPTLSR